jgi:hypothetical protein
MKLIMAIRVSFRQMRSRGEGRWKDGLKRGGVRHVVENAESPL